MTTLTHDASASLAATRVPETQAVDNYVLAARVVHRAETLLEAAAGDQETLAHIEAAFAAALALTASSSWAEVRAAREHLDAAQDEISRRGYWLR